MVTLRFPDGTVYDAMNGDVSILTGNFASAIKTNDPMKLLNLFYVSDSFSVNDPAAEKEQTFVGYKLPVSLSRIDEYYYIVLAKEGDS